MKPFNFFTGIGVALVASYLFDPRQGKRRRIQISQRIARFERRKMRALHSAWEDARNRFSGVFSEAKSVFHHDDSPDAVIEARVRSALGRHSDHPSAIEVSCLDGIVTLGGHILADEVQEVVTTARRVRGVKSIDNVLHVHQSPEELSLLQGEPRHVRQGPRPMRPGTALMVGSAGLGLTLLGMTRKGTAGRILGIVGVGMLLKGFHDIDGIYHMSSAQPEADVPEMDYSLPVR